MSEAFTCLSEKAAANKLLNKTANTRPPLA